MRWRVVGAIGQTSTFPCMGTQLFVSFPIQLAPRPLLLLPCPSLPYLYLPTLIAPCQVRLLTTTSPATDHPARPTARVAPDDHDNRKTPFLAVPSPSRRTLPSTEMNGTTTDQLPSREKGGKGPLCVM